MDAWPQGPFHELHNPFRAISVRQRTGVSGHEAILRVPNREEKERRLSLLMQVKRRVGLS
jgi:hypothetical protein